MTKSIDAAAVTQSELSSISETEVILKPRAGAAICQTQKRERWPNARLAGGILTVRPENSSLNE